jgi:hypothetical protein
MDVQVDGTGVLNFAASQALNALTVKVGARANVTPGGDKVLRIKTLLDLNLTNLQNGGSTAGRLELADNDLIVDYAGATSPIGAIAPNAKYTGIQRLLQLGRNGGTWDGVGLITDRADADAGITTLAVAEARDVIDFAGATTATWGGQTVDQTTVLVKYTYAGDANLDGIVSGDDYSPLDFSILTPGTAASYARGDFNYDGLINGDDYSVIDFGLIAQGPPQ